MLAQNRPLTAPFLWGGVGPTLTPFRRSWGLLEALSTDRCGFGEFSTVKHPDTASVKHPDNNPKPSVKHPDTQVVKRSSSKTTSSKHGYTVDNLAGPKRQNQALPYRQRIENKRLTANRGAAGKRIAPQNQNQNPRIAYAERRVKPLARLLRYATALRVTAPLGCGSRRPGMPERFPFGPSTRPECSAFWAWCGAIERYQMRYKDCLIRSPPFPS